MPGHRMTLIAPIAAVALAGGLWALNAQTQSRSGGPASNGIGKGSKLDDLLERKLAVPFSGETPLSDVTAHLARELKVRVVLDPAAMARRDLQPEDPIQLDLPGTIRLKTALPLLLDQLGLTYRFVEEDDLLVLTDAQGAGDSIRQVMDELRDIHRDIHDLQDAVDDLYDILEEPGEAPRVHKPKIVKEAAPPADDSGHPRPRKSGRIG